MPDPINIEELKKGLSFIVEDLTAFKQYTAIMQLARPEDRVVIRGYFLKAFWLRYQNNGTSAPTIILNEALHAILDTGITGLGGSLIEQLKADIHKDTDLATHTYFLLGLLILRDNYSTDFDKKLAEKLMRAYETLYVAHRAYTQFMRNKYLFVDEVVEEKKAIPTAAMTISTVASTTAPIETLSKQEKLTEDIASKTTAVTAVLTATNAKTELSTTAIDTSSAGNPTVDQSSEGIPQTEIKPINTVAILNAFNGKADTYIRDAKNRDEIHRLLNEAIKPELPYQDAGLTTAQLLAHPDNKTALQRIFSAVRMAIKESSPQIEMTEYAAARFVALIDLEYEILRELNPLLQLLATHIDKVISQDTVGRITLMSHLSLAARKLIPHDMPDAKAQEVFAHPGNIESFKMLILSCITFIQEYSALHKLKKIKASDELLKLVNNSISCFLIIDDFQNFCLGSSSNEVEKIFLKVRDLIEKFTDDKPLWTLHEKKLFKPKTIEDQRAKFVAERLKEFDRDFPALKDKEEAYNQLLSVIEQGQYTFNAGTKQVEYKVELTPVAEKLIKDLAKQMQEMLNVAPVAQKQPGFFKRLLVDFKLSYPELLRYFEALENLALKEMIPKDSSKAKKVFYNLSRSLTTIYIKIIDCKDVKTNTLSEHIAIYYAEVMSLQYQTFAEVNPLFHALLQLNGKQIKDAPATCAYIYKQLQGGFLLPSGFDYVDVRMLTTHAAWFTSVYAEENSMIKRLDKHQYIIQNNNLLLTRINDFTDYYIKLHPMPKPGITDAYNNSISPAQKTVTDCADLVSSSALVQQLK